LPGQSEHCAARFQGKQTAEIAAKPADKSKGSNISVMALHPKIYIIWGLYSYA
jgi:hypothetical protein